MPNSPRYVAAALITALASGLTMLAADQRQPRTGLVRAEGRAMADAAGTWLPIGASYFAAPWFYRHDRARLERELAFLADYGVDYIRVIGTVGTEHWEGREIDPGWPDYAEVVAGLTDLAYDRYGLRVQWTIFGDAQVVVPDPAKRAALVDRFAEILRARAHKVQVVEIANEAWQNGFPGEAGRQELRALARRLRDRLVAQGTPLLVAASAPGPAFTCDSWQALYRDLDTGLATIHFERDTSAPAGVWHPVKDPWRYHQCEGLPAVGSNNEPIGPGSSVVEERDALRLVTQAAVTFIGGLATYVVHSDAGVRGDQPFVEMPRIEDTLEGLRALARTLPPETPNGTRLDLRSPDAPLRAVSPLWHENAAPEGLVGAYATRITDRWVGVVFGMRGTARFVASRPLRVDVVDPLTGQTVRSATLAAGAPFEIADREAVILFLYPES